MGRTRRYDLPKVRRPHGQQHWQRVVLLLPPLWTPDVPLMEMSCPRCHYEKQPTVVRWKLYAESTRKHLGVYCATCGAWLKWLPQTAANRALVDPPVVNETQTLQPSQLTLLRQLGE